MKYLGQNEIIEYGLNIARSSDVQITQQDSQKLAATILQFMNGQVTLDQASEIFKEIVGTSRPIEAISDIIEESQDPNPLFTYVFDKKTPRHWSAHEDTRLLAGVYIYGVNDWKSISNFVGANRGRAQCLQRWTRTLKPSITKDVWTPEEDAKLCQIIAQSDKLSWTKVAHIMGNRSDVQCRYHFSQLVKNNLVEFKSVPVYGSNQFHQYKQVPVLLNGPQGKPVEPQLTAQPTETMAQQQQQQQQTQAPQQEQPVVQPIAYTLIPQYPTYQTGPILFGYPYVPASPPNVTQRTVEQAAAPLHIDHFLSCFAH